MIDIEKLKTPFPLDKVSWRVQGKPYEKGGNWSAKALAYIDARDVMNRLDEVVGAGSWQVSYHDAGKRVFATISIKINNEWVSKSDAAGDTEVEAEKGAVSDSFKRAAVHWGIGRYLYDLDAPYVPCKVRDNKGQMQWSGWLRDPWEMIKKPPVFASAKQKKTSGSEIIEQMRLCKTIEQLEETKADYREEILTFKSSNNEADKKFYNQIIELGSQLRKTFEQLEIN